MQCSDFYRGKVKKGGRCKVCVWGLTTIKFWEPWHWLCFSFILLKCLDKQRTNVLRIVYTFFYFSILGNSLTQPIAFCVRQAVPIHGHRNISSERKGIQREMFYFRPCVPPPTYPPFTPFMCINCLRGNTAMERVGWGCRCPDAILALTQRRWITAGAPHIEYIAPTLLLTQNIVTFLAIPVKALKNATMKMPV